MDDLIIIDSNKDRLVNILESIKLELIIYKNNLDKFYRSLASYNGLFLRCNIDNCKNFVII